MKDSMKDIKSNLYSEGTRTFKTVVWMDECHKNVTKSV